MSSIHFGNTGSHPAVGNHDASESADSAESNVAFSGAPGAGGAGPSGVPGVGVGYQDYINTLLASGNHGPASGDLFAPSGHGNSHQSSRNPINRLLKPVLIGAGALLGWKAFGSGLAARFLK